MCTGEAGDGAEFGIVLLYNNLFELHIDLGKTLHYFSLTNEKTMLILHKISVNFKIVLKTEK